MTATTELHRAAWAQSNELLSDYYDSEWGMPVHDERGVFERLTLEAFQSGLAWLTVLKKRDAFREAFAQFDPEIVATFGDSEIASLLEHPGIIRNRAKIEATINNARACLRLREQGTHIGEVVWAYMPEQSPAPEIDSQVPTTSAESRALAADLKKRGFSFVGPTTMYALMTAIGIVDAHLVGSHRRGCSGLWNLDGTRRVAA